jgi:hypothetical protein
MEGNYVVYGIDTGMVGGIYDDGGREVGGGQIGSGYHGGFHGVGIDEADGGLAGWPPAA